MKYNSLFTLMSPISLISKYKELEDDINNYKKMITTLKENNETCHDNYIKLNKEYEFLLAENFKLKSDKVNSDSKYLNLYSDLNDIIEKFINFGSSKNEHSVLESRAQSRGWHALSWLTIAGNINLENKITKEEFLQSLCVEAQNLINKQKI
jgi:hypothetical protein